MLKLNLLVIFSLVLLILVAGCTSVQSSGLSVTLQADPPIMFSKSSTVLHIDLDNQQDKSVNNVAVELFDTGLLSGTCSNYYDRLLPYEFQTFYCPLTAPEINNNKNLETEVNVRTSFTSSLSANQVFGIMTENEYQRRVASGTFAVQPRDYIYADKNVQISVQFSDDLPLVIRQGKDYFVYFTITNIGNGMISSIRPEDLTFVTADPGAPLVLNCPDLVSPLTPSGNSFPKIACRLSLPNGYFNVKGLPVDFRSADFLVNLAYSYELRNSLMINIVK